jgi:phosphomannomutase
MISDIIFHAYDVRGIYPNELNEETTYKIGQALVQFLSSKFEIQNPKLRIVVGRDCRLSSPKIFKAFAQGVIEQGTNVIDLGLVPTDAVYFALNFLDADAAVMITASHNPPQYAGIKMVARGPKYICGDWGIPEIKKMVLENKFISAIKKGKIIKRDIISDYIKHIINIASPFKELNFYKIIVDAGNGMAGEIVERLAQKLKLKITCLFCKQDGQFPNHLPNPLILENIKDLQKAVVKAKAAFGLAFDGDADRTIFVDEKGKVISGDLIIALFAKYFLKKYPGSKIVYNLTCSKVVPEIIKENGGQPIRTRTGHAFMKQAAKDNQAIFGGEISGHLYYQDNFYAECGGLTLLLMLKILSESQKPLSSLIKELKRYHRLGEINLKVKNREEVIKKLAKKYRKGNIDYLDGLTVQFKDWWFNARPSNTEPLLRLVVEAKTKNLVKEKKNEILKVIKK